MVHHHNCHQVESWGTPIRGEVVENVEVGGTKKFSVLIVFANFWFNEVFLKFVKSLKEICKHRQCFAFYP